MSAISRFVSRISITLICLSSTLAYGDINNFEDLPDLYFFNGGGQNIGTFYPGVTFGPNVTGLSVSRFGGYDSSGFPPHSGDVVIWDAMDPTINISFTSAIKSFGIWYTSFDPIVLQAFDQGNNLLGTVTGDANTDGTTGISSFLSISSNGIESVDLTSSAGLFVLDDMNTPLPEPNFSLIVAAALVALIFLRLARGQIGERN